MQRFFNLVNITEPPFDVPDISAVDAFMNGFACKDKDLPPGWESKKDKNGKVNLKFKRLKDKLFFSHLIHFPDLFHRPHGQDDHVHRSTAAERAASPAAGAASAAVVNRGRRGRRADATSPGTQRPRLSAAAAAPAAQPQAQQSHTLTHGWKRRGWWYCLGCKSKHPRSASVAAAE